MGQTIRQEYASEARAQGLMAWYGYARAGRELDIAEALRQHVHRADAPRQVEAKSRGKDRTAKLIDVAYVPNRIFITATAQEYNALCLMSRYGVPELNGLSSTFQMVPLSLLYGLHQWSDQIEAAATEAVSRAKAGELLSEFNPGDLVKVEGAGAEFADWFEAQDVVFSRMVQAAHDPHPFAEVEVQVFGRAVPVKVDPLKVKRTA